MSSLTRTAWYTMFLISSVYAGEIPLNINSSEPSSNTPLLGTDPAKQGRTYAKKELLLCGAIALTGIANLTAFFLTDKDSNPESVESAAKMIYPASWWLPLGTFAVSSCWNLCRSKWRCPTRQTIIEDISKLKSYHYILRWLSSTNVAFFSAGMLMAAHGNTDAAQNLFFVGTVLGTPVDLATPAVNWSQLRKQ